MRGADRALDALWCGGHVDVMDVVFDEHVRDYETQERRPRGSFRFYADLAHGAPLNRE